VLLLLGDGSRVLVVERPGRGPWTFLVLEPPATAEAGPGPGRAADPGSPELLTRHGRVVAPDLGGRPGFGAAPGEPGFLALVDDLDQIRTRAGLGRPVLAGFGELATLALRAAVDQPWAWRGLLLAPAGGRLADPSGLEELDLPALVVGDTGPGPLPGQVEAVQVGDGRGERRLAAALERLLGRLGPGPGWGGIAPDAPPR
jgi:pimeloyl-ACP methyl ester carboxylesterase